MVAETLSFAKTPEMLFILLAIILFLNPGNEALPIQEGIVSSPSALSIPSTLRSTFGIVWSCATTTFLCAWVSVHLDTIHGPENSSKRRGYRILFMSLAVIIPEFIVGWAMKQRIAAEEIHRRYKKNGWTTTHAHLLDMGGFTLCLPEEKTRKPPASSVEVVEEKKQMDDETVGGERDYAGLVVDDDVVRLCFIETLDFERFNMLLDEHSIEFPTITKCEIKDRAKSDGLSKFIAGLQTWWFILQCIARHSQNLAITELELTTLALASLNVITLIFWWSKPMDVTIPVPVYILEGSPEWHRRKANLEKQEISEEELRKRVGEWERHNTDFKRRTEEWECHREESQWRTEQSQWLTRELNRRQDELRRHQDELKRRQEDSDFLSRISRYLRTGTSGVRSFVVAALRFLVMLPAAGQSEQESNYLSKFLGLLLAGLRGVRDLLVAGLIFPVIRRDEHTSSELGDKTTILSRQDVIESDLDRDLGPWMHCRLQDVYPRAMRQFLIFGLFRLMVTNIGHGIKSWWTKVDFRSRRGWAMVFVYAFLGVFVIVPIGIPFLVVSVGIVAVNILSTPLTALFLQFPRICNFVEIYVAACVSKSDPDKIKFYLRSRFTGGDEAHFVNGLVIGTIFGGLHCVGWNFVYPTSIEQTIWRAMSLTLTIIPTIFLLVCLPFMDPWPLSPVVAFSYFNRYGFLIFAYLIARFTIVTLALVLLRNQPASAYVGVKWTQLFPHVGS